MSVGRVSRTRYIEFRLVDISGNPVTGQTLSDFVILFTRDNVACTDPLTLVEGTLGHYVCEYVPTAAGHDYVELYHTATDTRIEDAEDIDSTATFFDLSGSVQVTQDYGGVGRLVPTTLSPQNYTLYAFLSIDYQSGNYSPAFAKGFTALDTSGNWITTPMTLLPDTYHFVLLDSSSTRIVVAAFISVASSD